MPTIASPVLQQQCRRVLVVSSFSLPPGSSWPRSRPSHRQGGRSARRCTRYGHPDTLRDHARYMGNWVTAISTSSFEQCLHMLLAVLEGLLQVVLLLLQVVNLLDYSLCLLGIIFLHVCGSSANEPAAVISAKARLFKPLKSQRTSCQPRYTHWCPEAAYQSLWSKAPACASCGSA